MPGEDPNRSSPNLSRWACFSCRRSKVCDRGPDDHPGWDSAGYKHDCPECDEPMLDLGRDVALPKKNDDKGWQKLADRTIDQYWRAL